jgi:hypothetical protein
VKNTLQATILDADWETLRLILPRINGPPNNANENMGAIVALLEDQRDAKRAAELAGECLLSDWMCVMTVWDRYLLTHYPSETGEFVEYLLAIDYQKYYETIPNQAPTGAQNVEFSAFSLKSLKATIGKLDQFLALVPPQALEDASSQMEIVNSGF